MSFHPQDMSVDIATNGFTVRAGKVIEFKTTLAESSQKAETEPIPSVWKAEVLSLNYLC